MHCSLPTFEIFTLKHIFKNSQFVLPNAPRYYFLVGVVFLNASANVLIEMSLNRNVTFEPSLKKTLLWLLRLFHVKLFFLHGHDPFLEYFFTTSGIFLICHLYLCINCVEILQCGHTLLNSKQRILT